MKDFSTVLAVSILSILTAMSTHAADTLSVTLTGDLLLDRGVRQYIEHAGIDRIFKSKVDSIFKRSDIVIANLECPVTKIKQPVHKRFVFRGEPEWLNSLHNHGITHLNLANNHSIDQGRDALIDTWKNIENAGMIPFGAGINMKDATTPCLIAEKPRRIWMIASVMMPLENFPYFTYKPSSSIMSVDSIVSAVNHLRQQDPYCYIIVSLHWGWEHTLKPQPFQKEQAHRIINAGADIMVCHHTHTLQTIEEYKNRLIYYSIGNFIFDQKKDINDNACLVRIKLTKDSAEVETIPIHSNVFFSPCKSEQTSQQQRHNDNKTIVPKRHDENNNTD